MSVEVAVGAEVLVGGGDGVSEAGKDVVVTAVGSRVGVATASNDGLLQAAITERQLTINPMRAHQLNWKMDISRNPQVARIE
jgi:hypothetical protein